jgi:DNA-binding PadR family transcriptional regulator
MLLGLILETPQSSTSELLKRLNERLGGDWEFTEVARLLRALESHGLIVVTGRRTRGAGSPRRFMPSELAEEAFTAWLGSPVAPLRFRPPLHAKLCVARTQDGARVDRALAHYEQDRHSALAALRVPRDLPSSWDSLKESALLEWQKRSMTTQAIWARGVRRKLAAHSPPETPQTRNINTVNFTL